MEEKYQKIIIIGAPRSGTNILRDSLTSLNGIASWPCDEINSIWRHGNIRYPDDELPINNINNNIKNYIRTSFNKIRKKYNSKIVIEKTCANSLRIPFVDKIIPEAKYIFITRDYMDVVGSAVLRWKSKLDIYYTLKKCRYIPLSDIPYYSTIFFKNRIYKIFSKDQRLYNWGPQFKGINQALENYTLEEVCALQWKRCFDLSTKAFNKMPSNKIVRVRYEDFVTSPVDELIRVLKKFDIFYNKDKVKKAVTNVTNKNIGKGRKTLSKQIIEKIDNLIYKN